MSNFLPMVAATSDCHVHSHVILNNVYCLEWSCFYCCTCLITWKMALPKSPGALLRDLSKVLLDGSKALQASQKRDYNNENANSCMRVAIAIL